MKIEIKVIHNGRVARDFDEWSKQGRIRGFTTLSIHRSYGSNNGPFMQDNVSGEKYMSFLYFDESEEETGLLIKKELEDQGFFVVLSYLK